MGNLPTSRTITLATGDALPSNLVNEIQDVIVGGKHTDIPERFVPSFWGSGGGADTATPTLDPGGNVSPVWKLNTTATILGSLITPISYKPGQILTAFSVDIYGDAVVNTTYDLLLEYYPTQATALGSVVQIAHVSGVGHAAAWSTQNFTIDAPGQVLAASGVLFLWVKILGNSTPSPHFCYISNCLKTMNRL